jgi:hypothetical protein
MKHPPVQYPDTVAKEMVRIFICGRENDKEIISYLNNEENVPNK